MAEKIVSPGVFTRESDQSQIIEGPIVVDAAVVGPTVKGPVEEPTIVTSFSDYKAKFGGALQTGSQRATHLTTLTAFNFFEQGGESLLITRAVSGTYLSSNTRESAGAGSNSVIKSGSTDNSGSFDLQTISKGIINNSVGPDSTNGVLHSGSADNIRWESSDKSNTEGTFNLLIRRGNDTKKEKVILEQFIGLSLDPFSPNYIEKVIGNQRKTFSTVDGGQINTTGSFINNSRYVRVSAVNSPTFNYLDNEGNFKAEYTQSLPKVGSGSLMRYQQEGAFGGAKGKVYGNGANGNTKLKMFEEIDVSSIQGLEPAYYTASLSLLENQDEYDYELLIAPGVTIQNGAGAVTSMISTVDTRGDAMAIVDTRNYGSTISQAVTSAATQDTSYAATYWPWVQVLSNETGKLVFVPASTVMAGVYATNDRLGAEWFAPAGFNRGGVGGTIQAERKLSPSQRDTLYLAKINPIATFPGQGPVVFGQKTLQTKSTSLDRVNVRRLLIELKRVVGQVAESLLFEQNTQATRNRFLNQVNPYLESVQQRQGLYAYRVVMDSTNNTAEVIDRNQMVGQIFIQPTRTAEFIILDFNITPTGVEF